jgi:hypothetical protein
MAEAAEPLQPHFGPPDTRFLVRSNARMLRIDQVDYWEGALQLLSNKLCLKMIEHGSRSTRQTVPRSFWIQITDSKRGALSPIEKYPHAN